jgi:beta-lactamase superfamily II metal-dependent hydrolase
MLSVFILDAITLVLDNKYVSQIPITDEDFSGKTGDDKIHFLNTANSDCIIIESNGHFALVDSGEGNRNPRKDTPYKGYRDEVINYIKKVCADENGKVKFDFVLATHMHYDHAGNFVDIANHKDITIGFAYMNNYDGEDASAIDRKRWGNSKLCKSITKAFKANNIPIIQDIPSEPFEFGDFTLQFINTKTPEELVATNENANSVCTKITKGEKIAFLAADMTADTGLEGYYAETIGDVDLLKIGHHGYFGSCSQAFLKTVKPEICIVTNHLGKIYPNVKWNITMAAKAPLFSTVHRNGIIATFTDNNEILLTQNTM